MDNVTGVYAIVCWISDWIHGRNVLSITHTYVQCPEDTTLPAIYYILRGEKFCILAFLAALWQDLVPGPRMFPQWESYTTLVCSISFPFKWYF